MQFEAEFSGAFEASFEKDHIRIEILDVNRCENFDVIGVRCDINDLEWFSIVKFGPDCPNGRFDEALNSFGEIAYIFKLSPEKRAKLTPVIDAARAFRSWAMPVAD